MVFSKNDYEIIRAIGNRVETEGVRPFGNRLTLFIDLELAVEKLGIDLERLLNASRFDFIHDIAGIQKDIDRVNKQFSGLFLPRCVKNK